MPPKNQNAEPKASAARRALYAAPILALAVLMARAFAMAGPTVPFMEQTLEKGRFESNGVSVAVLKSFYGISLLDEIFASISAAFVQLQSQADPAAYWQSLLLLTDFAGVYAALLLEASRPINRSSFFQFPSVMAFVAQLAGGGLIPNVYLYFYYVFRPIQKHSAPTDWRLDGTACAAVLPSIVIGYYIPHFLGYFHSSLEGRHWWSWLWQLYPVWAGTLVAIDTRIHRLVKSWAQRLAAPGKALRIAKQTCYIIAVVNALTYWYTLSTSTNSLSELFVPKYLLQNPESFAEILKTILQYDHICCFTGNLLWLAYSFGDLKAAGICRVSWARLVLVGAAVAPVFGVGNLLLLGWLNREEMIDSWITSNTASKKK